MSNPIAAKSTRVVAGKTISDVVNRLLNKPKGTPTKQHWNDIYRKDPTGTRFVPLADPGKLLVGETLYHVPKHAGSGGPAGTGSKSAHDSGKPVSEGVTNAAPRPATETELITIRADARRAEQYIQKAQTVLTSLSKNPAAWHTFRESFVGEFTVTAGPSKGFQLTAEHLRLANAAAANYGKMLAAVRGGKIRYMVQDTEARTPHGVATAYAQYGGYIAFTKGLYFAAKRSADDRARTLVHELAHYAWDAGHAYSSPEVVQTTKIDFAVVSWQEALRGADRYADFALRVGTGK